jgi:hypothetical protein
MPLKKFHIRFCVISITAYCGIVSYKGYRPGDWSYALLPQALKIPPPESL